MSSSAQILFLLMTIGSRSVQEFSEVLNDDDAMAGEENSSDNPNNDK